MNLFSDIRNLVLASLEILQTNGTLPKELNFSNVTVEPPRDASHGDMSTNAAMVLAKPAGMNPRLIADALSLLLVNDERVISADVAGPGFLNLCLKQDYWTSIIPFVLNMGTNYGRATIGTGIKVNVEYVSANPTGPLHVGHTRGAVFGDALASLLDFAGFEVTENISRILGEKYVKSETPSNHDLDGDNLTTEDAKANQPSKSIQSDILSKFKAFSDNKKASDHLLPFLLKSYL